MGRGGESYFPLSQIPSRYFPLAIFIRLRANSRRSTLSKRLELPEPEAMSKEV